MIGDHQIRQDIKATIARVFGPEWTCCSISRYKISFDDHWIALVTSTQGDTQEAVFSHKFPSGVVYHYPIYRSDEVSDEK